MISRYFTWKDFQIFYMEGFPDISHRMISGLAFFRKGGRIIRADKNKPPAIGAGETYHR